MNIERRRSKPRLMDMSFICRLSLMWQAAVTAMLLHFAPTSLTAELLARTGAMGRYTGLIFTGFVLMALLDLIVNDLMPDQYVLRWAARYRWLGVAAIGVVYLFLASVAAVGYVSDGEWVLIAAYVGLSCFCLWWSAACVNLEYRAALGAKGGRMC